MHSKNKHIYCTLVSFSITELEDAMQFQNIIFILGDDRKYVTQSCLKLVLFKSPNENQLHSKPIFLWKSKKSLLRKLSFEDWRKTFCKTPHNLGPMQSNFKRRSSQKFIQSWKLDQLAPFIIIQHYQTEKGRIHLGVSID